jgi:DNA-binding NarL/FixJ family response regulator
MNAISEVMAGKTYLSMEVAVSLRKQTDELPLVSRREKEVLLLIADGFTNAEIAEKLFISIPTVNSHRKSLLSKFGVNNTAGLIKLAVKHDFL